MADVKVSALPAISALDDDDVVYVVEDGVSKQITMTQLTAYFEGRGRQNNSSVANQGAGFATDTYITGSYVTIPQNPSGGNRLQAKSQYRLRLMMSKTAAGTAAPVFTIRLGTAGTTSDASRVALTHAAQTAVGDSGCYDLQVTFRTVGSGTSAVIAAGGVLDHQGFTSGAFVGLANVNTSIQTGVSAGFDSTVANLGIGVSLNAGSSAAWTIQVAAAELYNLV